MKTVKNRVQAYARFVSEIAFTAAFIVFCCSLPDHCSLGEAAIYLLLSGVYLNTVPWDEE